MTKIDGKKKVEREMSKCKGKATCCSQGNNSDPKPSN